jgi:methylenetetrahydrofolate--tRNA-(uracil-5-)-methyltransferase
MARWRVPDVTVIGGGLAGTEAAWQLAERGHKVSLVEMKPEEMSPAHETPLLCELVCTNSLRSDDPATPAGLLKQELRRMKSLVIGCADRHYVPAGAALAVERFAFGREVTTRLAAHPNVRLERRSIDAIPEGEVIVATGPLTGGGLAAAVRDLFGGDRLYFYDAIAPIVSAESIDPERSFFGSRYGKGGAAGESDKQDGAEGDYINCPLTDEQYYALVTALVEGRKVTPHAFEEGRYFEGCLPLEVMAMRGPDVLRYGPLKPVGLRDPRTGKQPFAVVQLRPENRYLTAYNLVGFQTRLAYPEQRRIFRMIPALEQAEFLRYGSIHRNTYIDAPRLLGSELELRARPEIRFAGLIAGVEGYIESCAMGLLTALFCAARLSGRETSPPPETTALGGLYHHVTRARGEREAFSPTNVNFGLMPRVDGKHKKRDRRRLVAERAALELEQWLAATAPEAACAPPA